MATGLLERRQHRTIVDPAPRAGEGVRTAVQGRCRRVGRAVQAAVLAVLEDQVLGTDRPVGGEDHRAFDDVAQLADVARVVVGEQHLDHLGGQRQLPVAVLDAAEEVLGDGGNVALVLAQRRHVHREGGEPVVEVLAELAAIDHALDVAVGRGDDADVDLVVVGAADAADGARLEHAQQLGLQRQRQFAHLVDQQGAAVGGLEQPLLARRRPRVGPLLAAEQLVLDQVLAQRAAVDDDERPLGTAGVLVHVLGHALLAGTALAGQQHRGQGRRDALQQAGHAQDRPRAADQQVVVLGGVHRVDELAHVEHLAVLAEQRRGLDLHVLGPVVGVEVDVHHLGGLLVAEHRLHRAVLAVVVARRLGMVRDLVAVATDQPVGLDAVALPVAAVGGDDPVLGVDDDERVRQDIDDLVARGFAPRCRLRVHGHSSGSTVLI